MIALIIAIDRGNAIGWSDGTLAYSGLKQDMKRFKELTTGGTVVMGMNTWKSLNRPTGLPNRKNVVLTRKPYSEAREFFSASADIDIISSLNHVKMMAGDVKTPAIWLIGGKSLYEEALRMDIVDEMYITLIHAKCEANVVMDTDLASWKLFVLRNPQWAPTIGTSQWDGDFQTTYLHLAKQ